MDSPLLPRTSQLSSAAGGNLLDESVESNFADLTFDNSSVASSAGRPPPARSSFLPPPRAPTSKPRFSLFAPGASIAPREPSPPPTPLFVRADASAASSTVATASTSSRANPQASASAAPSHASESAASTPQHSLGTSNEPLTVSQLGGGGGRSNTGVDDGADGADMAMQEEESADATLRRTLYELQGLNRLFDKLLSARQGVNVVHERAIAQTQTTNALLDNYIATLRDENRTIALIRNPGWTGASDDAIHMQTLMATLEREREELRQQTLRMEEEAARAREAAERDRAAAEEAARRREAGGAGGRGGSDRGRGIARGSLRGSRGRGGAGLGSSIPTPATTTARGKTPSYAGVKSSGYGPPPKKRPE